MAVVLPLKVMVLAHTYYQEVSYVEICVFECNTLYTQYTIHAIQLTSYWGACNHYEFITNQGKRWLTCVPESEEEECCDLRTVNENEVHFADLKYCPVFCELKTLCLWLLLSLWMVLSQTLGQLTNSKQVYFDEILLDFVPICLWTHWN